MYSNIFAIFDNTLFVLLVGQSLSIVLYAWSFFKGYPCKLGGAICYNMVYAAYYKWNFHTPSHPIGKPL